jgi:hypothetical protein
MGWKVDKRWEVWFLKKQEKYSFGCEKYKKWCTIGGYYI